MSTDLNISQSNKYIKMHGLLCARMAGVTGRSGKMGDAVIIEPRLGFYAIGDSSDRNPDAAREFMSYFSEQLDEIPIHVNFSSPEEKLKLQREIISAAEDILSKAPVRGSFAFTGLVLLKSDHNVSAVLFHSGDTSLYIFKLEIGMSKITNDNFWLLGKSRFFYQVGTLDIEKGTKFLFTTDGYETRRVARIARNFRQKRIEDILDDVPAPGEVRKDDVSLLALDPWGTCPDEKVILFDDGINATRVIKTEFTMRLICP